VKCVGARPTTRAFEECQPRLTLGALQKLTKAAAMTLPFKPSERTSYFPESTEAGGGVKARTEWEESRFVGVTGCHRDFLHSGEEDGCSVMVESHRGERESYNGTTLWEQSTCVVESPIALGVAVLPLAVAKGMKSHALEYEEDGEQFSGMVLDRFTGPAPFAALIAAVGPNPDPPTAQEHSC
jgi:hypothetical protein